PIAAASSLFLLLALAEELLQRSWVGVVPTHFDDLPILDSHELAHRSIKLAALMHGDSFADRHDIFGAHGEVEQMRSERASAERVQLCEEVIPDRRPALMGARDAAVAWHMPDRIVVQAFLHSSEISSSES